MGEILHIISLMKCKHFYLRDVPAIKQNWHLQQGSVLILSTELSTTQDCEKLKFLILPLNHGAVNVNVENSNFPE